MGLLQQKVNANNLIGLAVFKAHCPNNCRLTSIERQYVLIYIFIYIFIFIYIIYH